MSDSQWDYLAPTLADAHSQWHNIHGKYAICDLDCGAAEALAYDDPELADHLSDYQAAQPKPAQPTHRIKHYGHTHATVAEVRFCEL